MGDRAVITTAREWAVPDRQGVGIYVHWIGSDIPKLLNEVRKVGYRDLANHQSYGLARLIGWLCDYIGMDSDTGIGVGRLCDLDCDNGDNGVFILDEDFRIVDIEYSPRYDDDGEE